jgi:hypothetical protein
MYSITYECSLENQKDYEIHVEPPSAMKKPLETAVCIRYYRYHIEYMEYKHEIVCPGYIFKDGSYVIVIPWYLIPGRWYPIQIYLYACSLYSSDPTLGQRGAARKTREKFKLEKFSHSTVSRTFRALEEAQKQALERRFGEEIKPRGDEALSLVNAAATAIRESNEAPQAAKRIPPVEDTATRRKAVSVFLRRFLYDQKTGDVEAAGRQFVKPWHEKARRLLL